MEGLSIDPKEGKKDPEHEALMTLQKLQCQINDKNVAYQEIVDQGGSLEEQSKALKILVEHQDHMEMYRLLCKQRHPSRMEFFTYEEIQRKNDARKIKTQSVDGRNNEHYVPKDLPVMQIMGSEKWHLNKIVHLSAEMCLRAFENELYACNLPIDNYWQRLLPKCFNDAQSIWFDSERDRFP